MNYERHYSLLVSSRKTLKTESDYHEAHHIVPRSFGGSDNKSNMVNLTPREHFVAHLLLAKIHGGKMWAALKFMAGVGTKSAAGVRVTARLYAIIKQKDAEWRSARYLGENNPFYGKTFTPEQLEKLKGPRQSISGKNNPNYGKNRAETGRIISAVLNYTSTNRFEIDRTLMNHINDSLRVYDHYNNGHMFRRRPEPLNRMRLYYQGQMLAGIAKESNRDISGKNNPNYGNGQAIAGSKNPMFGKSHKDSTKAKIGEKAKRRIKCPHCGKEGNIANMHRWHLDNCKAIMKSD